MANSSSRTPPPSAPFEALYQEASGPAVAHLIRIFGDIDVAEDAVQEAFIEALRTWPRDGIPGNPTAWILTTGRNRAVDRLRRDSLGRALLADAAAARGLQEVSTGSLPDTLDEDSLRLLFTCCHPALAHESQVGLTLRLFAGLPTPAIARAFLVEEATMAQRIVRAKRKIKAAHIPYRIPTPQEIPARIPPALAVAYLTFNAGGAGQGAQSGPAPDFCGEGIRLARRLHALLPDQSEPGGLLALLLLSAARHRARVGKDGALVLLRDQDRTLWDRGLISEGLRLLGQGLQNGLTGPYQLQASIQAEHCLASTPEETNWRRIVSYYDALLAQTGSPVVALNRAIAVGEHLGPKAALQLMHGLSMEGYYLFHSTIADFLRRIGRFEDARASFERAASLAPTEAERRFLTERARSPERD